MARKRKLEPLPPEAPPTGDGSEFEWVEIDSIQGWDRNPRVNDHAVPDVVRSIERFGFLVPIVVTRDDRTVRAGHTRLKAAQQLRMERVPVIWTDLSEVEAAAFAINDNKTAEAADWDEQELARILRDLQAEDALEGLAWADTEIDAALKALEEVADGDEVPEGFEALDEDDIKTEHQCPKCGYEW